MTPKIALTGASGMLGRELYAQLVDKFGAGNVIGYCGRRRTNIDWVPLDLVDQPAVKVALERDAPDVIIHSAAIRRPDEIANDEAFATAVNVDSVKTIAQYVKDHPSTFMIFLSTDYVFDGRQPPYAEDAPTSPLNEYAKQKVAGEQIVNQMIPSQSCVLRVPIMYGRVEYLGEGAVDEVYKAVLANPPGAALKLDDYHQRFPLHVTDAARAVIHLIYQRAQVRVFYKTSCLITQNAALVTGIYQWRGAEKLTKYTMAMTMADVFARSNTDFVAVTDAPPPHAAASRPHNACMAVDRMEKLGMKNKFATFKDGIEHALEGMQL